MMAVVFDPNTHPHRRFNQLSGSWIICSPHRAKRPWQGQEEEVFTERLLSYDPKCYLCPGNTRVSGMENPAYDRTYVFTNDFSALAPDTPNIDPNTSSTNESGDELFIANPLRGTSRVVCFSSDHGQTLATMDVPSILDVGKRCVTQFKELESQYQYVAVFENKGIVMGCSNSHPHGQIWGTEWIPEEIAKEVDRFTAWSEKRKETGEECCLLCAYIHKELDAKIRIVVENSSFVVVVPYWAYWPFEVLVLPRRHMCNITELTDAELHDWAMITKSLLCRYDNLFRCSFPYSAGWHQRPSAGVGADSASESPSPFHLHMHYYPPLLRSATVKKFTVGFELLGELCRDITAEQAAELLREAPEIHYLQ